MKLASQLEPHGMAASMELREDIYNIIQDYRPRNVIETGTYNGLGSTSAILHGLKDAHRGKFSFISMESDPVFYNQARQNLEEEIYDGSLVLMNKISVPKHLLPVNVEQVPEDIITDHADPSRYLREVPKGVEDNGLMAALILLDYKPDMVLLDSAGHLGTIEFYYLIQHAAAPFILILDDTLHRKHYKTMAVVRTQPEKYTILKESKNKFGHAIIQVK